MPPNENIHLKNSHIMTMDTPKYTSMKKVGVHVHAYPLKNNNNNNHTKQYMVQEINITHY